MVTEMVSKRDDPIPSQRSTAALKKTLSLHSLLLISLFISFYTKGAHLFPFRKESPKPIQVVYLPPPEPQQVAQPKPSGIKVASPSAKKTKTPSPSKTSKETAKQSQEQSAKQAEANKKKIAEIAKRDKTLSTLQRQLENQIALLQEPVQVNSSADTKAQNHNKSAWIIAILQSWLQLPEYGEVELLIELSENGTILKLEVLRSESALNASYLVENLAHSQLPLIFEKEEPKTYILTLGHADD